MHKAWRSIEELPFCLSRSSVKFQAHMGWKIDDFKSNLSKITRPVAAVKSLRAALFIQENVFENAVCEMAAILSRLRWVNYAR